MNAISLRAFSARIDSLRAFLVGVGKSTYSSYLPISLPHSHRRGES